MLFFKDLIATCGRFTGCFLVGLVTIQFLNLPLTHAENLIRSGGSTTVLPVISKAATLFMKRNPDTRITVSSGGSGVGVQGVGQGILDIGLASRELTPREQTQFKNRSLQIHVIGRDAIACVVSSEIYQAGVHALTPKQIRSIYEGRIRNWSEVGGPDRPIVVIDKERHRGTRHVFMNYIFGNPQARAPGARLVTGSNNEEQAKVAQSDSAIGMLSFAWMNRDVRGLAITIENRNIEPTQANVKNGVYPISRNLNLIVNETANRDVRAFVDFLLSDQGQAVVKTSQYIPIRPSEGSHLASDLSRHP